MEREEEEEAARLRGGIERARGLLLQGRVVEALKVVLALRLGLSTGGGDARAAAASASAAAAAAAQATTAPPSPADVARLLDDLSLAATSPPDGATGGGAPRRRSLLDEAGRGRVAADAVADGSSVVCGRCRGVIAARRMAQHAHWCSGGGRGEEEGVRDEEEEEEAGAASSMEEG